MNTKKTGARHLILGIGLSILMAVQAFAAENFGPAFANGTEISVESGAGSVQEASTTVGQSAVQQAAEQSASDPWEAIQGKEAAEKVQAETAVQSAVTASAAGETPIGNVVTEESKAYDRGGLIGNFQIVGYYGAGHTYTGIYTTANRTIAADQTVLPLGSKVFIGDTVYTVEDIGSGVKGNMIDIYFDSYQEAANVTLLGRRYADVYTAIKKA